MIAPLEEVRSYEAVKLDVIFDFMWKIINFAKYLNSWFLDHCIFPDTPLHNNLPGLRDSCCWYSILNIQGYMPENFCLLSHLFAFLHFFEFKSAFISRVVEGSWPPTAYLSRQHSFIYPPCICRNKFVFFVANPYLLWQFHISVSENGPFLTLGSGTSSARNENLRPPLNTNISLISGNYGLRNHF